jgi:prepilin-type processing-associated H-X9-DG protein
MLVVIVIIGMLAALLLPALIGARARARQNQCLNNQRELASAIKQYETAKDSLPGYRNRVGGTADGLTWVAVLLPHLGRNDVWEVLRSTKVSALIAAGQPYPADLPPTIAQLVCPSHDEKLSVTFPLSYVANCGWYDAPTYTGPDTNMPLQPLFVDRDVTAPVPLRTDKIKDGSQNTLMLSENLQATQWFPLDGWNGTSPRLPSVVHVGMLWARVFGANAAPDYSPYALNREREPASPPSFPNDPTTIAAYTLFARPSSNHPGGVVVSYCDGHQDFLADDIDEIVYQQLMSPDDAQARDTAFHDPTLIP